MKRFVILFLFIAVSAFAQVSPFSIATFDSEQRTRYEALLPEVRCMVCANQSVEDSQSPFAQEMRLWLYEQIKAGRSDREIRDDLIARFGETVLYSPMLQPSTYLLWALPLCLVLMVLWFWYRGARP